MLRRSYDVKDLGKIKDFLARRTISNPHLNLVLKSVQVRRS